MAKARREILDSAKTGTITRRAANEAVREFGTLRAKNGDCTIGTVREIRDDYRLDSISTKRGGATSEPGLDSRHRDSQGGSNKKKK